MEEVCVVMTMKSKRGFGLVDVMVAMAILFIGSYVMISVLPRLINAANSRSSLESAYIFASSKADEIYSQPYSGVTSASGNFNALLPNMSDLSKFSWVTSVTEEKPDLLKKVTLNVKWGTGADKMDTYIFYIADMNDD